MIIMNNMLILTRLNKWLMEIFLLIAETDPRGMPAQYYPTGERDGESKEEDIDRLPVE